MRPLQLLTHAVQTTVRALVAANPQVSITTMHQQLKAIAADAEVVINAALEESNLEARLTEWVTNAMLGLGVLQVGLVPDGFHQDQQTGEWLAKGKVTVDNISLDDFVPDMSAKSLDPAHATFYGHCYFEPIDMARANPRYDAVTRLNITAMTDSESRTVNGVERANTVGTENTPVRPKRVAKLWQFYFPRTQQIAIFQDGFDANTKPLALEDWTGPSGGPYHFLQYLRLPDNVMPLAPAGVIMDISRIADAVFAKESKSVVNSKTLLGYREGHAKDAAAIAEASHMDTIAMENPEAVREMRLNGPSQGNLAFLAQAMTLWNMMSGNVNLVAGLGTKSPTLGQDQLLQEASNQQLGAMRHATITAVGKLMEHWAWYFWHDPVRVDQNVRQVPNTDLFVPVVVTPEQRRNMWAKFNLKVEPYSLQRRSPVQKLVELDQVMATLMPMAPLLQQQGVMIDMRAWLMLKAKYSGMPEILEVLRPMEGNWPQEPPIGSRSTMPATRFGINGPRGTRGVYRHVSERNESPLDDLEAAAESAGSGDES